MPRATNLSRVPRRIVHSILLSCLLFTGFGFGLGKLIAQSKDSPSTPPTSAGETPSDSAAKYLEALRRRPTGGYLFDRFYDSWLETGSIDGLAAYLKGQSAQADATTPDQLLYAFFLVKQGREAEALGVFEAVLKADPDNAEAWAESAKAHARSLDFEKALAKADKALAAEPADDLAIELGKLKGRWLARSGKIEDALAAWQALTKAHPDDEELREDLVDLQIGESLIEDALTTQSELIETTDDPYLKITRRLRLGDIHLRAGEPEKAREIYRASLADAGRDTWLEKEILAQIEQLFRREDDLAGLKDYYAELIKADPGRIAALRRQAEVMAQLDEGDEAIEVFRGILKMTPGDRANRESFVALLGKIGKNELAVEQMTALSAAHPDDPELLAQLAVWQHAAKQVDAARETVTRYLTAGDGTEYDHLRAVRLLERFEQADAAAEILEKMVVNFPDSSSVREEQAAFLHRSGKKDEAVELWRKIAADGTVDDASRAARFLSSRGQRQAAYEILKSRVDENSTDFAYLGRLCEEALATEQLEDAMPWMEKRIALAKESIDLRDALRQAMTLLDRSKKTADYRENLRTELDAGKLSENRVCLLAELLERNGEFDQAEAVLKPLIERGVIVALHQRTRQLEKRGEWKLAAEVFRGILEAEGGRRSNHLQHLTELYRKALDFDTALNFVEEWKKLAPGNPQPWLTQADIENENGDTDAAIQILRRAAARFEDEESTRTQLAFFLQQQGKLADAERIYWNLYEESEDIGSKLRWVTSLANLASQQGSVERLVESFEERHRDNRTSIAPLLAIAEVHRRNNNYEGRREALLEATRLRPEDLALLQQIAGIEEEEGNWEQAADTLETALSLDKTDGTARRIAMLHMRYGEEDEGYRRFMELGGGEKMDADAVLGLADAMIARSGWERSLEFLETHRDRFPDDYRIGYLRAVALEEFGEDEGAIAAFVDLLGREVEINKKAASPSANANSYLQARTQYHGELPDGTLEIMQWMQSNYYSFSYRQQLQSGRIRYPSSSISSGGGGLVRLPKSLEELDQYAFGHVHGLCKLIDESDVPAIAASARQHGIDKADFLLELPANSNGSLSFDDPTEILTRYPDQPEITALIVIQTSVFYSGGQAIADPEAMWKCYQALREDYPHLALIAAMTAAQTDDEENLVKLSEALDAAPEFEDPPYFLTTAVTNLLLKRDLEDFSEPLRERLMKNLRDWRDLAMRRLEEKNKNQNALARFQPGDQYAAVLRKSDDLSDFAAYLDAENTAYRKAAQGGGSISSGAAQSSFGRYMRYIQQRTPLLSPLTFPPVELPGIAPNVLVQFVETPGISFGSTGAMVPISPEQAADVLEDNLSDPFLQAIFSQLASDDEATGKVIDELIAEASDGRERPPLAEALFAASWYMNHAQQEKAAQILESVRLLPMSQLLRQRIDSSLVVCAREADIDTAEFQKEPPERLAKWGPAAALRLRYGTLSQQNRTELASALGQFGLTDEAERLEAKNSGLNAARSTSSYSSSTTTVTPKGIDDKINQFIKDGKREDAEKLLRRTLEHSTRALASTPTLQWDYDLLSMLSKVRNQHRELIEKIFTDSKPADDAKAADWIRYAGLLELDTRTEEAAGAYQRGVDLLPKSSRRQHLPRLALLQSMIAPEQALKTIEQIEPRQLAALGQMANSIWRPIDYNSRDNHKKFEARINMARSVAAWLDKVGNEDSAKATADALRKTDLAWVESRIRNPLASSNYGLNDLFGKRANMFEAKPIRDDTKTKQRREVHDELCRAMISHPQLARIGFASLSCLRVIDDPETAFQDADLIALAHRAVDSFSQQAPNTAANAYSSWRQLYDGYDVLWLPEEFLLWGTYQSGADRGALEAMFAKVDKSNDRGAKIATEAFADLLFGEPDQFADAMQKYIDHSLISTNTSSPQPNLAGHANRMVDSTGQKAYLVWQARNEHLGAQFDMREFLIASIKKSRQSWRNESTILAAEYIGWLGKNEGWPAAQKYLYQLAEVWLGDEKRWDRFTKEAVRKVPTGSGGYYHQGGDFKEPAHKQFAGFLSRCAAHPETVFPVMAFVDQYELDDKGQISERSFTSRLDSNLVTQKPELMLALIQQSPFVTDAESFSVGFTGEGRDPAFKTIFDGVANWKPKQRDALRAWLEEKATFGADLALAYLDDRASKNRTTAMAFPTVLGKYRATIDKLPEERRVNLALLVGRIYPKGVPGDQPNADARAVFDQLGTERAKSVREEAEEFLKLKNLAAGDIDRAYELEEKLKPFVDPLLKAGDWDTMERVYWHAIDLAAREQKKGTWDDYRSSWGYAGSFLYDLLDDIPGGGLERIGFFERVIRKDAATGRIALSGGGMRFEQHLQQAYTTAGGPKELDKALSKVAAEVWKLTASDDSSPLSHLGLSWQGQLMKIPPADSVRAIAWADANCDGKNDPEWSPMAREIAMAWRNGMTSTLRKDFRPFAKKVPDLDAWVQHYLNVLADDSLSVAWRMAIGNELCDGAIDTVPAEIVWACSELMATAIADDHQFNGWSVFYVTQEFCALPRDERWIALADKISNGWFYRNRLNQKDHSYGQSWYPWDELVLQMLDMHCKLGNEKRVDKFIAEANAHEHLDDTARAIFCLVEHGFFPQANKFLENDHEWQDVGTDYTSSVNDYTARYTNRVHQQLPAFLETVKTPGLRCFAECLIGGALDPAPNRRDKDAPKLLRVARLRAVAERFADVDFQGNDTLRRHTLRQLAISEPAWWIVREPLRELYDPATLGRISASQNYRRIQYDVRTIAARAANHIRTNDLRPVREFLKAMKESTAQSYYRREAIGHFSQHLTIPVKNRVVAMQPKELQTYADALHLLITAPDKETIEHSGLQALGIAKISVDVFLELKKAEVEAAGVKTQLAEDPIAEDRLSILQDNLYRKVQTFWGPMTQTMKFRASNPDFRPDAAERRRRVDALLAHPMVQKALKSEKDHVAQLLKNEWLTEDEMAGDWGKEIKALWEEDP